MVRLEMSRPGQMAPAVETTALAFPDRARMPNAAVLLITCQNLIEQILYTTRTKYARISTLKAGIA